MSLSGAWFADRAPGLGKRLIVNAETVGLSGVIIVGQPSSGGGASTIPSSFPALPDPGSTIPPAGSSDRSAYLIGLKAATGFDGWTTLSGWKAGSATATAVSLSVWVNLSADALTPTVPGPTNANNELFGSFLGTSVALSTAYPGSGLPGNVNNAQTDIETGNALTGLVPYLGGNNNNSWGSSLTYPNGTTDNWVHLMFAYQIRHTQASGPSYGFTEQAVIVVNDTVLVNTTASWPTTQMGFLDLSNAGPDPDNRNIGGFGGKTPSGDGLAAGLAEYWFAPSFIDWTAQANRYKFHITDGVGAFQTWAPCDLGPTGRRPGSPLLYLSGAPSTFVLNRADSAATLTTNTTAGHGLFLVDDPPS